MSSEEIKLRVTPEFVGGYQMGGPLGIQFNLSQKPNRWHQFWMRICLGWVWVDA